jgi:hypothetical protein
VCTTVERIDEFGVEKKNPLDLSPSMFDSDLRTQLKVAQRLEQMSSSGTQPVENSITFIEEAVSIRRELIAQNDLDPATRRAMEAGLARSLLPLGRLQLRAAATVDDGARSIVESVALLRGAARAEAAGEAASMKKQRKSRALVLFSGLVQGMMGSKTNWARVECE